MPAFTDPNSPHDISELLVSAGFPHITITEERRNLAYECILLSEVVTKRIPALDDLRRGLGEVKVSGVSLLSLLEMYPELEQRVFPKDLEIIDEREMASHIQYDESSNPLCQRARKFFEQYIEELFTGDYSSVLEILFSQLEIGKCQLFKNFIQINPFKLPPPPQCKCSFFINVNINMIHC